MLAVVIEREAELRGDDDLVAYRRERLTDDLLVDERAVHLSGVEEGYAAVDGGADERDALLPGGHGQVALAQAHAAVADGRDLQPLTERSRVHFLLLFSPDRLVHRGSTRIVVARASGLVMCAIADVAPWYLRAYSASTAGSTSGCSATSTSTQVTSRATPRASIRPWWNALGFLDVGADWGGTTGEGDVLAEQAGDPDRRLLVLRDTNPADGAADPHDTDGHVVGRAVAQTASTTSVAPHGPAGAVRVPTHQDDPFRAEPLGGDPSRQKSQVLSDHANGEITKSPALT